MENLRSWIAVRNFGRVRIFRCCRDRWRDWQVIRVFWSIFRLILNEEILVVLLLVIGSYLRAALLVAFAGGRVAVVDIGISMFIVG